MELGRRPDVRHPARLGRQRADVQHRRRRPRRRTRGASSSTPTRPYKGKVTAYDSPIYIADAALYLMATKPDLGITNPYALDDNQFDAAVDLLKAQRGNVGEYWSDYTKSIRRSRPATRARHHVAGHRQPRRRRRRRQVDASCRRRARPAGPTPG